MKTYYVELEILTGEYEKDNHWLIEANSESLAKDYALYCESHDPEELEWSGDEVVDMGGEFVYRVLRIKTVTPEDAISLQRYMTKHICDRNELIRSGNYCPF